MNREASELSGAIIMQNMNVFASVSMSIWASLLSGAIIMSIMSVFKAHLCRLTQKNQDYEIYLWTKDLILI